MDENNMDDEGPPRKRLQSGQRSDQRSEQQGDYQIEQRENRIAELERLLVDANKKVTEQSATIRELNISLEAARRESEFKERIISEKENIIKEKDNTIKEKDNTIKEKDNTITALKDASESKVQASESKANASEAEANLRIMTAEKKYQDEANRRVREKTEEVSRRAREKIDEANQRVREKTEEANRLLKEANQRENLLRQDLHQANRRENNLMRELSKAQDLHLQTKREGRVMFGFLETGVKAFDRLCQTKSAIADRHGEKIAHLKTVGKLLGEEAGKPSSYGVQVTREDPESQHLNTHRYTVLEGTRESINDRCSTPVGTFIPTVDPDSEYLRFQSTCEDLIKRHTLIPSGLVFNLTFCFPVLEWTDASRGNLFAKEDIERALCKLSADVDAEDDTLTKLTESVNALVVAVPQDKKEHDVETSKIRSSLKHITEWMKENGSRINQVEPIKRRLSC